MQPLQLGYFTGFPKVGRSLCPGGAPQVKVIRPQTDALEYLLWARCWEEGCRVSLEAVQQEGEYR
jgi:hypothetical protein